MPTMYLGGPVVIWTPLESEPEPETGEIPYWQTAAAGYPGAVEEPAVEPETEPVSGEE